MLNARYQALSDREKLILWLGSLLALVLLAYLLLWRPLAEGNQRLRQQLDEKQALLGWMQQAAAEVQQLQRQGGGARASAPLQQLITTHAGRQQLKLERMQSRSDNEAQLWLEDAEFNRLLGLLDQLNRDGVVLQKAQLRATPAPGQVDAQLTFGR